MTPGTTLAAFGAESQRLSQVLASTDDVAFARPTACVPWTVAELAQHVRMTMSRLPDMLAASASASSVHPPGVELVSAVAYYRPDQRFSAATNADRIDTAQHGAAALPDAAARARDFADARQQAWELLQATPPDRIVRTRHGDPMLLTEFLRTRVLELAVHGLDLAAALNREPWMTAQAAEVTAHLLLPPPAADRLRAKTGWDEVTMIAKLTGRSPTTPSETQHIRSLGARRLVFG